MESRLKSQFKLTFYAYRVEPLCLFQVLGLRCRGDTRHDGGHLVVQITGMGMLLGEEAYEARPLLTGREEPVSLKTLSGKFWSRMRGCTF